MSAKTEIIADLELELEAFRKCVLRSKTTTSPVI